MKNTRAKLEVNYVIYKMIVETSSLSFPVINNTIGDAI